MNYVESVAYLNGLGNEYKTAKLGLETIRLLLEEMGNPDEAFKSIVIAGTNGKGSVAAMLESVLRKSGFRVGLYTSPHLIRMEERIRVLGTDIAENDFARLVSKVRELSERLCMVGRLVHLPTFFEQITAVGLEYFREQEVELAVLEVGLGGRLDATNAVKQCLSIITTIALDHTEILGDSVYKIAVEKGGVIKRGSQVVIGRQGHSIAGDVLMRKCLTEEVLPVFANEPLKVELDDDGRACFDYESSALGRVYQRVLTGLRGRHQAANAASVIEAVECLERLGWELPRDMVLAGLREVVWPGRLELIEGRVPLLVDSAHNVSGALSLVAYLKEAYANRRVVFITSFMKEKDFRGMLGVLKMVATSIFYVGMEGERALSGDHLEEGEMLLRAPSLAKAMELAMPIAGEDGVICVAGSLRLVGALKSAYR